jgi:hypothetical protein
MAWKILKNCSTRQCAMEAAAELHFCCGTNGTKFFKIQLVY